MPSKIRQSNFGQSERIISSLKVIEYPPTRTVPIERKGANEECIPISMFDKPRWPRCPPKSKLVVKDQRIGEHRQAQEHLLKRAKIATVKLPARNSPLLMPIIKEPRAKRISDNGQFIHGNL